MKKIIKIIIGAMMLANITIADSLTHLNSKQSIIKLKHIDNDPTITKQLEWTRNDIGELSDTVETSYLKSLKDKKNINHLNENNKELTDQIESLKLKINNLKESLEKKLDLLVPREKVIIDKMEAVKDEIKTEINNLPKPAIPKDYDNKLKILTDIMTLNQKTNSQLNILIVTILGDVSELKTNVNELISKSKLNTDEIKNYKNQINNLENIINELKSNIINLPNNLPNHDAQFQSIINNIAQLKRQINNLPQPKNYNPRFTELKTKLSNVETSLKEKLDKLCLALADSNNHKKRSCNDI